MTSAELAAAFVVVMVPLAVAARWLVLSRRGHLEWSAQVPLTVAGVLIMASAIVITGAGFVVQQLLPPLLIVGIGGLLVGRPWGSIGPIAVRWLGFATLTGGIILLLRAMAIVVSNGG